MHIGASVPRKEARAKLTGAARYVDDVRMPDMLLGATVRSPVAHGRIRGVDVPTIPGLVVVTAKDIPGPNCIHLILDDQPALADGVVRHAEEAVVLLAHEDRALLERARA